MIDLSEHTYSVLHSPNCPSPFLIRLCGFSRAMIDYDVPKKTHDAFGYGKTFDEAARNAMNMWQEQRAKKHKEWRESWTQYTKKWK